MTLPTPGQYATGMLFLDKDSESLRQESKNLFEAGALELGLKVIAWRDVPTNPSCLGEVATGCEPHITQVSKKQLKYSDDVGS